MRIGIFLAIGYKLAGNTSITYYAPIILGEAGFDGDTFKSILTLSIGAFKFICLLFAF